MVSTVDVAAGGRLEKDWILRIIPSSEEFSFGISNLLEKSPSTFPHDCSSAEPNARKINAEIT